MNKYRLIYFYWIVPAYLIFLVAQQGQVHLGAINTFENGETLLATVTDFEIKQIAAQSNGYVDIEFQKSNGETVQRRLTLSIQMAQTIMESPVIPIRYKEDSSQPIVLFPTYEIQKSTTVFNMGVAFLGLLVTVVFGVMLNRYIARKLLDSTDDDFQIEMVT